MGIQSNQTSMGNLRSDTTDTFPVERRDDDISYIFVPPEPIENERSEIQSGELVEIVTTQPFEHFKSTKSDKVKLLNRLRELESTDDAALLGIWAGEWRADVHELDIRVFIERLEEASL